MEIHIIENQVTENMLGVLSARVLRRAPNIVKTLSLYEFLHGNPAGWLH